MTLMARAVQSARRRIEGDFEKARLSQAEADHEVWETEVPRHRRSEQGEYRENTTDARGEGKVMLQDKRGICKDVNCVGKENLERKKDLIKVKKLENLICQATQGCTVT